MVNASFHSVEDLPSVSRLRQGFAALRPTLSPNHQALIDRELSPPEAALVRAMPPFDQRHLCRVYECLLAHGETDCEVLTAALLHDVGKVDNGRAVSLVHRVVRVLLGLLAPSLLRWLARLPMTHWRAGFALAVHHPALGAAKAAAAGSSPRVCWLIAHHEDLPIPDDPALRRMIAADNAS